MPDELPSFFGSWTQLTEFELCVVGNLCPETVDEAIAIYGTNFKGQKVDGCMRMIDDETHKMLNDLALIKQFEQFEQYTNNKLNR